MIHRNHLVATILAITVMLALCAASPAAARPQPYPGTAASSTAELGTNLCSEVCSGGAASASAPTRPAPTEQGGRFPQHPRVPLNSASTPIQATRPAAPKAPTSSGGFDWGAAAIGASGAILLTLAIGGGLATIARRGRRPRQSSASATG